MANYDDFKQKAKDAFDTIADASVDAYKVAEDKARVLARKTKLRAGIVNEKATIRRLSVELGTEYYKKYKDIPGAMFNQLCEEITCAYDRISEKEAEIAKLKASAGAKAESADKADEEPKAEPKQKVVKAKAEPKPKSEPEPEPKSDEKDSDG